MAKPCQISAGIQAVIGGVCVAMMAASHHLPIDEFHKLSIAQAAMTGLFQAILAIVAFSLLPKLKIFGRLTMATSMFGQILFTISTFLSGFGIISHAPTAPFGGTLFILSWLFMALGIFSIKDEAK